MFLDEGIIFKVSPNPGLNLTHLQTTGPRRTSGKIHFTKFLKHYFFHFPFSIFLLKSWMTLHVVKQNFQIFLVDVISKFQNRR